VAQQRSAPGSSSYQVICGAVAAAPLVYMGVAAGLKFGGVMPEEGLAALPPESAMIIPLVLLAAGTLSSVFSIVVRKLLMKSQPTGQPAERFRIVLVSMAVSESGAVMGLVLMLLTGNLLYGGLLCGLSFAVTCFHFPSRHWLDYGDQAL
jgi:hypothetical protein